jgi:predicted TIM-barrel fold metal-dependent hydrolase
MKDLIDAHVHVWTPDTERYPLAPGFSKADMKPPSFAPEELFAHCKPEGVTRIVLIQMSFYGLDNSYMLDQMKRFPGTFGGVGVVDWTAARPDDEMKRLAKLGVRGFRVRPGKAPIETWMETPSFERMFKFAADHHLAICPLIDPTALPSLSRMCAKHLKTRVVIDHLSRIGVDGEIREADVHALCTMAHFPEVRVKVSAFYALGKKKPPHDDLEPLVRTVYDAFGAKRLMWASDCPFAVDNERYRDSIALVRDGCPWLKADDREWLFRKTAEGVFFK